MDRGRMEYGTRAQAHLPVHTAPEIDVNMVLNVHRNHRASSGLGEGGTWGMEMGEEGDYILTGQR